MPAHRGNKTDFTFGTRQSAQSGRAGVVQDGIDPGAADAWNSADNFVDRYMLPVIIIAALMLKGHQLNEPHVIGFAEGQGSKIGDLVVVDTAHHHSVYFNRGQPGCFGCINPGQHLCQMVLTGNSGEPVNVTFIRLDPLDIPPVYR